MTNVSIFVKKVAERSVRTFLQGYLAAWLVNGADYQHLFTVDNTKLAVVAFALSIAMSLGLKNVGPDKNSPSAV